LSGSVSFGPLPNRANDELFFFHLSGCK
jgi:hypothetical protein